MTAAKKHRMLRPKCYCDACCGMRLEWGERAEVLRLRNARADELAKKYGPNVVTKDQRRRARNPEKYRAKRQRWYHELGGRERIREWNSSNRPQRLEVNRAYRDRNKEYLRLASRRDWERKASIPAPRAFTPWTLAEEAVAMRDDLTTVEKCYILGRSYSSISARRKEIRTRLEMAS
jgi:hypothetical protein